MPRLPTGFKALAGLFLVFVQVKQGSGTEETMGISGDRSQFQDDPNEAQETLPSFPRHPSAAYHEARSDYKDIAERKDQALEDLWNAHPGSYNDHLRRVQKHMSRAAAAAREAEKRAREVVDASNGR